MKHQESALPNSRAIVFGPFRLSTADQSVYADGQRVAIGAKAYQILLLLVSHPNEVIPAERFNRQLWPDTSDVSVNLRVQIASLRKALSHFEEGEQYIQNVSGRGYRFAGKALYEENFIGESEKALPNLASDVGLRTGSQELSAGDEADIHAVGRLLASGPVTTIVGAGGVGKTALALKAMRSWCAIHSMDAVFVDLSSITSPAHVESALVSALTPTLPPDASPRAAIDLLRNRRLLVVLDSCEHVIDAAASLADTLARTSGAKVLATSREPLRVDGESVHRVLPLPFPTRVDHRTHASAETYPAFVLFKELARAAGSPLPSTDIVASQICRICELLDGLPLALELAVKCLSALSPEELITRLEAFPLEVLIRGRRTSPLRHRSIRSSIDWSYDELTQTEQRLYRYLSIFEGPFTLDQAHALMSVSNGASERDTLAILLLLIDKSLITVKVGAAKSTFSMFNVVRSHGAEKLHEFKELDFVRHRHVRNLIQILTEPAHYHPSDSHQDDPTDDAWLLMQVRSAFAWLMTTDMVDSPVFTLGWASHDIYVTSGHLDEYRNLTRRLLERLPTTTSNSADDAFRLHLAFGRVALESLPVSDESARRALRTALCIARQFEDHQRAALAAGYAVQAYVAFGDYEEAAHVAATLRREIGGSSDLYDRTMATLQLSRGNLSSAAKYLNKLRGREATRLPRNGDRMPFVHMRPSSLVEKISEAQLLWLTGHVTDANSLTNKIVEHTRDEGGEPLCRALSTAACLIACWNGDTRILSELHRELADIVGRTGSQRWLAAVDCFKLCVPGASLDHNPLSWISLDQYEPALHEMLATVNRKFLTPTAVDRAKAGKAGFGAPEILRNLGENLLTRGSTPCVESESLFKEALALSRRHGSVLWELRASISLAKLRRRALESYEAMDILNAAMEKVADPGNSADSQLARALLEEISQDIHGRDRRHWQ